MRSVALTLLYAINPAEQAWRVGYARAPLPPAHGELQREEGERVLESARRIAQAAVGSDEQVRIDTEVAVSVPIPTLIDATKDAQMIVVGSRGRGAWRRGLFGSVSTALVHHAHCPVAVIREPADAVGESRGPVVVGIDGSPASELATAVAFDEASWRGAELVALHAWIDSEPPGLPRWPGRTSNPRPRRRWPSDSPAGTTAIPTSSSIGGWCSINRPAICSRSPKPPSCWSLVATVAGVRGHAARLRQHHGRPCDEHAGDRVPSELTDLGESAPREHGDDRTGRLRDEDVTGVA